MELEEAARCWAYLNTVALKLENESACFKVHYWGIDTCHLDNLVHRHSFFEICYVLDGEGTYWEPDSHFALAKGTMFMTRPGVTHQIRSESGMYLLFIAFELDEHRSEESIVQSFARLSRSERFIIDRADNSPAALTWLALFAYLAAPDSMAEPYVRSVALSLLLSFYPTFKSDQTETDYLPIKYKASVHTLNRAIRFLRDNLSQPLTLTEIADYLHISSRHLSRLFRQELGMSFIDYVLQEKLQRSAYHLKNSSLSIQEIAELSGFNSVHYFTRLFTRKMGISPGRYRLERLK
ncbi:AraC family transcriptional regulator [Cohnella soli]|uniref:AraC family transcriptional regulator n=1 Tax=Cohnella soli TaxID=425005 RepID=A0ABW0HTY8_9BACL